MVKINLSDCVGTLLSLRCFLKREIHSVLVCNKMLLLPRKRLQNEVHMTEQNEFLDNRKSLCFSLCKTSVLSIDLKSKVPIVVLPKYQENAFLASLRA